MGQRIDGILHPVRTEIGHQARAGQPRARDLEAWATTSSPEAIIGPKPVWDSGLTGFCIQSAPRLAIRLAPDNHERWISRRGRPRLARRRSSARSRYGTAD